MYFIQEGDCIINIKDEKGNEYISEKILIEGDHFGEVAMIYQCKRTASVVSRNYNTMARLQYE